MAAADRLERLDQGRGWALHVAELLRSTAALVAMSLARWEEGGPGDSTWFLRSPQTREAIAVARAVMEER